MLLRERPLASSHALIPPRAAIDHVLSAVAFSLFLASWVTAYVGLVPPDAPHRAHVTSVEAGR